MLFLLFLLLTLLYIPLSTSQPAPPPLIALSDKFLNPTFTTSASGKAVCVEGHLPIPVSAKNRKINYKGPQDDRELTAFFVDLFKIGSTFGAEYVGEEVDVTGEWKIWARLCFPGGTGGVYAPPSKVDLQPEAFKTVHFLTHGGTTDNRYWDFAPTYSYIDIAAEEGYATFSYDRLGTGKSDLPDPLQIVQAGIQLEIAHTLTTYLKNGTFGGFKFENVVGVGHSLGSALTQGVAAKYPTDFDALVLTGHTASMSGTAIGIASTAQGIARLMDGERWGGLASGYITLAPVIQTLLFGFYHYPNYDPEIVEKQFRTRDTNVLGELLTIVSALQPATEFKGPVYILNAQQDFFYCQGDCMLPKDLSVEALELFFPKAGRGSKGGVVDNFGHNLNLHYGSEEVLSGAMKWLVEVGVDP